MSMEGVGAYWEALRTKRGLTQSDIAKQINALTGNNTTSRQISRWEHGQNIPTGDNLCAYTLIVRGDANDVADLLTRRDGDRDLGLQLAQSLLEQEQLAPMLQNIQLLSPRDQLTIAQALRQLSGLFPDLRKLPDEWPDGRSVQ